MPTNEQCERLECNTESKTYCGGCKYFKIDHDGWSTTEECRHPLNERHSDSRVYHRILHPTITEVNTNNDCKMREAKKPWWRLGK